MLPHSWSLTGPPYCTTPSVYHSLNWFTHDTNHTSWISTKQWLFLPERISPSQIYRRDKKLFTSSPKKTSCDIYVFHLLCQSVPNTVTNWASHVRIHIWEALIYNENQNNGQRRLRQERVGKMNIVPSTNDSCMYVWYMVIYAHIYTWL